MLPTCVAVRGSLTLSDTVGGGGISGGGDRFVGIISAEPNSVFTMNGGPIGEQALFRVRFHPELVWWITNGAIITSGLPGNGTAANFTSADPNYMIGVADGEEEQPGEVYLGVSATVTFAPGNENASGEMADVTVVFRSTITLPICG